jgi:hypothetical protein
MSKWITPPAEGKYKISGEVAQEEVRRLLDFYESDYTDLPEERQRAVEEVLNGVEKGFRMGRLEIKEADDGLHVIQHLKNGSSLEYRPVTGKLKPKLDAAGDGIYRRMYLLLGYLSGLGEDAIMNLKGPDLRLAEQLSALFLLL